MIPQGYKQTEIGIIPEDWNIDTISSVIISVATGGNYKNSTQATDYPLIKMGNISRSYINLNKLEYIIDCIPKENDKLQYGDVLLNTRNTPELVGKVAVWKNELPVAYFNSNLLRFNFNKEKANSFFMNLILNTQQVITEFKNIAKGTTSVAAIYPKDMLKVLIKIPKLPEQEKIAETLSDTDDLISSLEKLIEKKKAIKHGAMQNLLTGKIRLQGFTGKWEAHKLGEYIKCIRGVSYNGRQDVCESENEQTIRLLRSNNIQDGKFVSKDIQYILRKIIKEDQFLCINDIMLCMANGSKNLVGKNCIFKKLTKGSYTFGAFMSCLRATCTNLDMEYLFALLNSTEYWSKVSLVLAGSSINNLRPKDILNMKFKIPLDIEEQKAIAEVLSDMDKEIEQLEQKLAKARLIKQGMMQQLLTGKIRIV